MSLQVKMFTNGMKAVLREQYGTTPALLRVFDKKGCLVAQREILKSRTFDGTKALEKMTLNADKYGTLEKTYKSVEYNSLGKVRNRTHISADVGQDVAPALSQNEIPNGLGWMERMQESEGALTSTDKTLFDMCKQWFIAPKNSVCSPQIMQARKNPKPMFNFDA